MPEGRGRASRPPLAKERQGTGHPGSNQTFGIRGGPPASKVSYYTYNYLDQPTSMTDIWGNTYTTSYETSGSLTSGRPYKLTSSISDSAHPPTLYTVNSFNPLGEQSTATFGNGIARAFTYDNRGRLTGITDGPSGSPVYSLAVGYAYGNVSSANDSINGNWSSFQYDDFNRLKSSTCVANCPGGGNSEGYTYSYDQYGNRWHQTLTAGSGYTVDLGFDASNHLTPAPCNDNTNYYCYDLAGNLLYNGNGSAQFFDAEGRITSYNSSGHTGSYVWDGAGQRVQRTVDGVTTDYVFDNQGHENTNATGGFAASAWSELYLGGMHVNTYTNSSTYFSHNDHLGSLRTQTDPSGSNLYSGSPRAFTNRPFGEWTDYATEGWLGFTGDLLDDPDGNTFHTPNRQYNEYQGRWLTPDPAGLAAVNPMNPQTWNRYAYVGNNPVSFRDPTGLVRTPNAADYMGGGGGGFNCTQDGVDQSCATVAFLLSGGAVTPCNPCVGEMGLDPNGKPAYVLPGANGGLTVTYEGCYNNTDPSGNSYQVCNSDAYAEHYGFQTSLGGSGGTDPDNLDAGQVIIRPGTSPIGLRMRTPFLVSCKAGVKQYATITIDNAQSIANIGVFNVTSGLQLVGKPTAVGPVGTIAGTGNWYQYFYTTTGGLMTWYVSGTANNNTPFNAYAREDIQCQ